MFFKERKKRAYEMDVPEFTQDQGWLFFWGGGLEEIMRDKLMDRSQGILWIKRLLETIHVNVTVTVSWPLGISPNHQ